MRASTSRWDPTRDGAAKNAIGADGVAAVTAGLCKAGFTDEQVANIAGLNACRVIAQRLSGGNLKYDAAKKLCRLFPSTITEVLRWRQRATNDHLPACLIGGRIVTGGDTSK